MKGRIVYPYEPSLSKNRMHLLGDKKLGVTSKAKKAMDDIAILSRPPFYSYKWNSNRIKVTITVYRSDKRSDAQNFIDAVSDALEVGLGIDDSNFDVSAIGVVDKDNPRIVIEVEQEEENDQNSKDCRGKEDHSIS